MTSPIKRALISVSDKTGLVPFAQKLVDFGIEILSTGGSAKTLRDAGVPVKDVSEHTGFPEIMQGRVKTLHPKIHGGILAKRSAADHQQAMVDHGIAPIDLVVVNLYPFRETLAAGKTGEECIENIDIGGPAMVRAAAKNHGDVTIVTDPASYDQVVAELASHQGATSLSFRRYLAACAFSHTAAYDTAISGWMQSEFCPDEAENPVKDISFGGQLMASLRYGENPHQQANVYKTTEQRPGVMSATQHQGKQLSYNNLADADAAFELVSEFTQKPTIAIIKHNNPCGIAEGDNLADAYHRALACDPVSAFGGIIAANQHVTADVAEEVAKLFAEVVIAPSFDPQALDILSAKKALRILETGGMADPAASGHFVKLIAGGLLVQSRDNAVIREQDLKVVTKRAPTAAEISDLLFAHKVCKHVKSNAIIYVKEGAAVGIGAGQMSRVDSSRIASWKAKESGEAAGLVQAPTIGSVVASDAFFPFADGLLAAVDAGATAVIQPGGSIRDDEVIAAADEAGIAMVFTGCRHFRH